MPTFRVTGRGRDTGRKRQQQYVAADEARAKDLAEAEGTSVESIERLPDAPPTERQLAYAKDLGISVPVDASIEDVSDLIDARLHGDKPAEARHQAIAKRYGVIFTRYTGKKALFDRLMAKLIEPGLEQDLVAWFIYRVYRELVGGKTDARIQSPDEPTIQEIARQLACDEAALKSIRRYQGRDLIWFGQWTAPDGVVHEGGSNQTIAYKRASSMLRDKLGSEVRLGSQKPPQPRIDRTSSTAVTTAKAKTGCLSIIVVGVISLLAVAVGAAWIAKAVGQPGTVGDPAQAVSP
ncbi:MAG TPA: hypothetical protein VJ646_16705 [Candidatus Binatia bacterium]|nr:hypothetical protein [Candidatus Binatia bacterium]